MTRAVYQVRLRIKSEDEDVFNAWYEGTYIPRLMQETPHFTAVHRYVGEVDGERIFVTDYETTVETMELAIAEMRAPGRAEMNAEFYRWKDRCITLHESIRLTETLALGHGGAQLP
jgi:hypothetical protein